MDNFDIKTFNEFGNIFLLISTIALVPLIWLSLKKSKEIYGEKEVGIPESHTAIVCSKRVHSPSGSFENINYVMFEKENGERIELAIKDDKAFMQMLENDKGTLTHLGKKFISFERNIKSDF